MLKRKEMPEGLRPAWEAFGEQAAQVQAARSAVLSCLPVGRVDRVPVAVGLDLLRDELHDVRPRLPAWRVDEVLAQWTACDAAIGEALDALPEAYRVAATSGELEELLAAVGDVVEPLGDAFSAAERRWLSLRTKRPRGRLAPEAGS